jgi:PhzF family phenazine biosynthesis protein
MRIPYYQVNAFTKRTFGGNPAGVCILDRWLPESLLQKIAAENDFAETAFLVRSREGYELRWFTPNMEIDLCGHATLGAAAVLFFERGEKGEVVKFSTRSGVLAATRRGDLLELDFPARPGGECASPTREELARAGISAIQVLKSRDLLAVFGTQTEVADLKPDMTLVANFDCLGVIVTAPGEDCDFVSRFFAPRAGVPEDPVTGSAHSTLIPYWANRLNKQKLFARQISPRGGELYCEMRGDRVGIAGYTVCYCRGEIEVRE